MKIKTFIILIAAAIVCLAAPATFAQTVNPNIQATTPESKFTDNGDGTVTDLVTGFMWKKSHEPTGIYTWQGALQMAQAVNTGGGFAGYTDWRVPNAKELRSIVEEKCYDPAINLSVFPETPSDYFWTSSPDAEVGAYAWIVNFRWGGDAMDNKDNTHHYVRLVRGGQ